MKQLTIVSQGAYEDYKEDFYLNGKHMGVSWSIATMLENLFKELGVNIEIVESTILENKTEYVVNDYEFQNNELPGTWIVFENGCMGLVIDNNMIKLQTPVSNSIDDASPLGEYRVLAQTYPEQN